MRVVSRARERTVGAQERLAPSFGGERSRATARRSRARLSFVSAARTFRLPMGGRAPVFAAMTFPRFLLALILLTAAVRAEEPFFKKGDVIAIVGGEDMVALSEYGYLELLLTRALPDYHLRFRNLAQEGDTVFEQRRDLNFPTWEEALEKIGATVVLCQFGQMESLAGKEKLPEFSAAYEKLLGRLSGGGKRRLVILAPNWIGLDVEATGPEHGMSNETYGWVMDLQDTFLVYIRAVESLAGRLNVKFMGVPGVLPERRKIPIQRDYFHLTQLGHYLWAEYIRRIRPWVLPEDKTFVGAKNNGDLLFMEQARNKRRQPLLDLIIAKNRLWFDYWRVQNWAFLAGDRTNQPSSRDYLDPTKRWFPEERERFLPLIEAKEREIDTLAAQLAQP